MVTTQKTPAWFQRGCEVADRVKHRVGVLLVVNVKGRTAPLDDYETDSVTTEFLSNKELDDFVAGFQRAGIYCEAVVDEAGFSEWLENGKSTFGRQVPLVYNLAQNGTGAARLTLIPALCRMHGLLLIDADGYSAALDQHKFHCSSLLENFGLPVARSWWFTSRGWWPDRPPSGLRVIAKPTYECASIGVHKENVCTIDSHIEAQLMELARQFRQPITVQEFIPGFEVEVPVLDAQKAYAWLAVGIELNGQRNLQNEILAYEDVFADGYGFYDFSEQDATAAARMMDVAQKAHLGLGCAGPVRIDFRVSAAGEPKIMEVNCKPHLTLHSSFMFALRTLGCSHADLLKFLIGSAAARHGIDSV